MKKLLCLLLAVSSLMCIAGCRSKDTEGQKETVAVTVDAEKEYLANLPERDYSGYEFTVLCTTQTENFYNIAEYNSELIPSAVYSRNLSVQEKYDISF